MTICRPLFRLSVITFFLAFPLGTIAEGVKDGTLGQSQLVKLRTYAPKQGTEVAVQNALANVDIKSAVLNRSKFVGLDRQMSFKLKQDGIADQRSSGRCWLFSGLSIYSQNAATKLQLDDFEYSHAFLSFYDKLEKSNLYLEQMIELRSASMTDRRFMQLSKDPIGDGGWFIQVLGLIRKYGLVPREAMPETKQSSSTGQSNALLNKLLIKQTEELRAMAAKGNSVKQLRARNEEMLADVYRFLCLVYGTPPETFVYRANTKDDKKKKSDSTQTDSLALPEDISLPTGPTSYTPQTFAASYLGDTIPEYLILTNEPNRPYNKTYRYQDSRQMAENDEMVCLNLPVNRLKDYVQKQLRDSQAVWFACDVSSENISDSALFRTGLWDHQSLLGIDFTLTKGQQLSYQQSSTDHAMLFAGYDSVAAGYPNKWLIENSWGKKGDGGYWYMYDDWFDKYVYLIVVEARFLDPDDAAKFKEKPVELPSHDVFAQALKRIE